MPIQINLRCKIHRGYSARRRPTSDCTACWKMWKLVETVRLGGADWMLRFPKAWASVQEPHRYCPRLGAGFKELEARVEKLERSSK